MQLIYRDVRPPGIGSTVVSTKIGTTSARSVTSMAGSTSAGSAAASSSSVLNSPGTQGSIAAPVERSSTATLVYAQRASTPASVAVSPGCSVVTQSSARQSPIQRFSTSAMPGPPRDSSALVSMQQRSPKKEVRSSLQATVVPPNDPSCSVPSAWSSKFSLNPEEPLLGNGAFAKILRVTENASATPFAVKVMSRSNFAIRGIEAQLDAEIDAMKRTSKSRTCRHVVRLFDTHEENDHVYLRLELCQCDLLRYANSQPGNCIREIDMLDFTRQLLIGLRDLHNLGILHRDVKPENLLVTSEGVLKIADFGWCAELKDKPSSLAGTFQYMAPEILASAGAQTEACDVWSSGITVIQLTTGQPLLTTYLGPGATGITMTDPHQATKVKTAMLVEEIYAKCPLTDEGRPTDISWRCWDCLRIMLMPEVELRHSVSDVLMHPWLAEQAVLPESGDGELALPQIDEGETVDVDGNALPIPFADNMVTTPFADNMATTPFVDNMVTTPFADNAVADAPMEPMVQPAGSGMAQMKAVVECMSSSTGSASTPRLEVPTPPCAPTPVKLVTKPLITPTAASPGIAVPTLAPVPAMPGAMGGVTKLIVSPQSQATQAVAQTSPQVTPKPPPSKVTPHVTPVRTIGGDLQRCRRSETAPSPLPLPTTESATLVVSSRLSPIDPPSPCSTSRTPVAKHVHRSKTSIPGDIRALQECEKRMASVFSPQDTNSRGSSVRVRTEPRASPAGPDLRTFTELVRNCGQSMRRASTSAIEPDAGTRRRHEVARSVTLKPRSRRREASPLRATAYPPQMLALPSTASSVKVPLSSPAPAQRGMPRTTISSCSVTTVPIVVSDPLSRTLPAGMLQAGTPNTPLVLSKDAEPLEIETSKDMLARSVLVTSSPASCGPPVFSVSAPSHPAVSLPGSAHVSKSSGPQRLVTQAVQTRSSTDRLSPRPFVSPMGRSPALSLRTSPPATPSPATFRDVMLQRSATTVTPIGA